MSKKLLAAFIILLAASFGSASAVSPEPSPTPWVWPMIPSCLVDPGAPTPGEMEFKAPVCGLYDVLRQGAGADVELVSAQRMNAEFAGVSYPAFLPGTEVVRFVVTDKLNDALRGPHQLVRVSSKRDGARFGSWWTMLDQVSVNGRPMPAEEIRSRLALPYTPACIAYADRVHDDVLAYLSIVPPAFDQRGGGIEWWFPPNTVSTTTVLPIADGPGCP